MRLDEFESGDVYAPKDPEDWRLLILIKSGDGFMDDEAIRLYFHKDGRVDYLPETSDRKLNLDLFKKIGTIKSLNKVIIEKLYHE